MKSSPNDARFRFVLRQIREEAGLSQSQLAAKLGKPPTFVSKSELGERRVDFMETLAICAVCRVTIHQFTQRVNAETKSEEEPARPKRARPRKWTPRLESSCR